jgi:hypothetical protein
MNEQNFDASLSTNYKEAFVDLLRHSTNLENGKLFRTWQVGPAEINALSSYKNIIATGEPNNKQIQNNSNNFNINMNSSSRHVYTHTHTSSDHILY